LKVIRSAAYDGMVVLGRLQGDAVERIASVDGSITVLLQL
jgi:hypothetical protein